MKKSTVSIVKNQDYNPEKVKSAIIKSLELLGGMETFVKSGQKVLLKPNILLGLSPDKAATTHPAIIAAVAELVREAGGVVFLGDSPGVGDFESAMKVTGIGKVVEEQGIELADFSNVHPFECEDNIIAKHIKLAKAVADADVIITLPKLKTHVQMTMTCAVKNQYGLVVGMQKGEYHFRLENRDALANLMVDINKIAKPALAICDAIEAMEGEGPSGGTPRNLGLILASADLSALDVAACEIIGLNPNDMPIVQACKRQNFGATSLNEIEIIGEPIDSVKVTDFKQIENLQSVMRILPIPQFLLKIVRSHWASKPRINKDKCVKCYKCRTGCPVNPPAIDPDRPIGKEVDDKTCIRCYCCHEFCIAKAIDLKKPWFDRVFRVTKMMNFLNKHIGKFLPHI